MDKKKIILIVDDDVDLLENTVFLIKSVGYDVIMAQNGVGCSEIQRNQSKSGINGCKDAYYGWI